MKGKYTADSKYDPQVVFKQVGTAIMLRRMIGWKISIVEGRDLVAQIRRLSSTVRS